MSSHSGFFGGSNYVPNPRDPLTLRYARTLEETYRDPYRFASPKQFRDGEEYGEPRPGRLGAPMRNAPNGHELLLQRALLRKPLPPLKVRAKAAWKRTCADVAGLVRAAYRAIRR